MTEKITSISIFSFLNVRKKKSGFGRDFVG